MRATPPVLILLGFLSFTVFPHSASAQSIEEIVKKHVDAMGGKEKLNSLNSIIMEGTFRLEGFELPLKGYVKNNEAQRYNVMLMKTPGFIIITSQTGWQYFPFQGMKEPQVLKEDELNTFTPYMDLRGALFDFQSKQNQLNLEGIELLDETPCYKINVKLKSGQQMITYLDTASFYILKTSTKLINNGKEQTWDSLYGNYQRTDEGFVFPFALTLGPGQAFVNKIIVNPILKPEIFDPVAAKTSGF
jgi:hypothetical protein